MLGKFIEFLAAILWNDLLAEAQQERRQQEQEKHTPEVETVKVNCRPQPGVH